MTLTISTSYNTRPEFDAALDEHPAAVRDRVANEFTHVGQLKQQRLSCIVGNVYKTMWKD